MSITGTGTQADPYIVTTYAELVEKAAESGKFVKVGNDINITNEYPDGDMPILYIHSIIDGDGKTISNWYKTNGSQIISIDEAYARLNNLTIKNIYVAYPSGDKPISILGWDPSGADEYYINNCNFSGYTMGKIAGTDSYRRCFKGCAFKIKTASDSSDPVFVGAFLNCCIDIHFTGSGAKLLGSGGIIDSYVKLTADDSVKNTVSVGNSNWSNSVIDSYLTTEENLTGYDYNSLCIVNRTHAPNYTVSGKLALVDDEHWLDTEYLASVGFNAG